MNQSHSPALEGNRLEKRLYAPPQLRSIELVTDEVLSKNCKMDDGGGEPCDSRAGEPQDFGS